MKGLHHTDVNAIVMFPHERKNCGSFRSRQATLSFSARSRSRGSTRRAPLGQFLTHAQHAIQFAFSVTTASSLTVIAFTGQIAAHFAHLIQRTSSVRGGGGEGFLSR